MLMTSSPKIAIYGMRFLLKIIVLLLEVEGLRHGDVYCRRIGLWLA